MNVSRTTITLSAGVLLVASAVACSDDTASTGSGGAGAGSSTTSASGGAGQGGASTTSSTGGAGQGGGGTGGGATGGGGAGAGGPISSWPVGTKCQNQTYQCADGLDNDNDGLIDWEDPDCLHPCDNSEGSLAMDVPGANQSGCKMDCFFDSDGGSGNDDCYWDHRCDPLSVAPSYYPKPQPGKQCPYTGDSTTPPASPATCGEMFAEQSDQCENYCKPLTPNGCDCFGCCAIPGAPTTVFLDSKGVDGLGKCTWDKLADPTACHPCTQVAGCLNECDPCEVCVGKPLPGPECNPGSGGGGQGGNGQGGGDPGSQCPAGVQACGLPGQAPCGTNQFCLTGCCYAVPS